MLSSIVLASSYDDFDILDDSGLLTDPLSDDYILEDDYEMPELNIIDKIQISEDLEVVITNTGYFNKEYYIDSETGEMKYGIENNVLCIKADSEVYQDIVLFNRGGLKMTGIDPPLGYSYCYVIQDNLWEGENKFDMKIIYGENVLDDENNKIGIIINTMDDQSLTLEIDGEYIGVKKEQKDESMNLTNFLIDEEGNLKIAIITLFVISFITGIFFVILITIYKSKA